MDISLAQEKAFSFIPRFSPDVAHDRVEQKKIALVAGTVASLLSRPKPTDIQVVSMENRLQPFWLVKMSALTRFDRNNSYTVTVSGPEVKMVSFLGQEVSPVQQVRATAVVRQMMTEMIKPVQQANIIHEERVDVEAIELNFRPIYAIEYEWAAKGKRTIIEFDGLTGDITGDGRKLGTQFKGFLTRDVLFDVTADAVSMFVPGGGIAVKLVKAAIDRSK
jgi:hypothetical protein